jgi:NADH-quinone oxidoreductase subunit F
MSKILKLITKNFDNYNPKDVDKYLQLGGFATFKTALEKGADFVVSELKNSGLKGRGGAAYPTWKKWDVGRKRIADAKYVICNADEGEPGTFKDRELLVKDPYRIIEGILISGFVFGSNKGFVYIREEYGYLQRTFKEAITIAKDHGYLGNNILGSGFNFEIEVFSGAGAYVCGEGSSLIESMEGRAGRPRLKPPRIGEKGYLDMPTLVNNVETLAGVVAILEMGGAEYAIHGTQESPGTKVISISGNINNPGVYEIPFGLGIREIINDVAGGMENGKAIKFLQLGGASGHIMPASLIDTKYSYEDLESKGFCIGSGSIVVADESNRLIDYLISVSYFFTHESCGKCTPCREGTRQLTNILNKLVNGNANSSDIDNIKKIANTMKHASFCGLGKTSTTALLSALEYFSSELWDLVDTTNTEC